MLEVRNLLKVYKTKGGTITKALDHVSCTFPERGLVFLLGKSGSGKSTLLNVTGGLDRPDEGEIIVKGRSSKDFSQADFDSYRNTYIGFIFQEYNILNEFNVEQNIALALELQGQKATAEEVNNLLEKVDMRGYNKRKPNTLSGGQKQRIAIARALIKNPEIIMADEPTGALDSNTGKQVFDTLKELSKDKLIIVVSHDREFAEYYGDRIIELKDGQIINDVSKSTSHSTSYSENVELISENTISIKSPEDMSENEFKKLFQLLKKKRGEVLISTGENVDATKKACRINSNNSQDTFERTKDIPVKDYFQDETHFIRSKMPFLKAVKMGVSGLKTKPIRLIFTILLSVVSFTMFGVLSTFVTYNQAYSISEALKDSANDYEEIAKYQVSEQKWVSINTKTGERSESTYETTTDALFGKSEIENLNKNNVGHRYAGVVYYGSYGDIGVQIDASSTDQYYYCNSYLYGVTDASQAYLYENGFTLLAGRHPETKDEIAISDYTYQVLLNDEKNQSITSNYSSIIGKQVKFSAKNGAFNQSLTIVGIYDVGEIPQKFDALKTEETRKAMDSKKLTTLRSSFSDYISKSFHMLGYVAPSFVDAYPASIGSSYKEQETETVYGLLLDSYDWVWDITPSEYHQTPVVPQQDLTDTTKYLFYDLNGNQITYTEPQKNQVYVPLSFYEWDIQAFYDEKYESVAEYLTLKPSYIYLEYENHLNNALTKKSYQEALNRLITSTGTEESLQNDENLINSFIQNYIDEYNRRVYLYGTSSYLNFLLENDYELQLEYADYTDFHSYWEIVEDEEKTVDERSAAFNQVISYLENSAVLKTIFEHNQLESYASTVSTYYLDISEEHENIYNLIDQTTNRDESYYQTLKTYLNTYLKLYLQEMELDPSDPNYTLTLNTNIQDFQTPLSPVLSGEEYYINYLGNHGKLTVIGYYELLDSEIYAYAVVLNSSFISENSCIPEWVEESSITTSYIPPEDERYNYAITKTAYTEAQIANMLAKGTGYYYSLTNKVYLNIEFFLELLTSFKKAFLIIGIVVGIFAALMMANFISVSISSKKREIGILRAVGAREIDVFKIFYSESFVITITCCIISIIASMITCSKLNDVFLEVVNISALKFGILNDLFVILIASIISLGATFIPVMIASKKQPVDSIRTI